MAQGRTAARAAGRRLEWTIRITDSTEIGIRTELRLRARRPRRRRSTQSWRRPFGVLVLLACTSVVGAVLAVALGGAVVVGTGALPSIPAAVTLARAEDGTAGLGVARSLVRQRPAPLTAVRPEAPLVLTHLTAPGETVFSIAARYGVTPQTVAYNNGLADTGELRAGRRLLVPPFDAAIHVVRDGESLDGILARFGLDAEPVKALNVIVSEPDDVVPGRLLLLPVPDSRYPAFRLRVSDAPRVFAPRVAWPSVGIVTQFFSGRHTGVDIAAPYGSPIVASDAGTVTSLGWRGPGGLHVCVFHDWGLETCVYHASSVHVDVGERVLAGQRIASVGSTGESSGSHVHWEARTNGVLVDPMSYAPSGPVATRLGGATGRP